MMSDDTLGIKKISTRAGGGTNEYYDLYSPSPQHAHAFAYDTKERLAVIIAYLAAAESGVPIDGAALGKKAKWPRLCRLQA